MLLANVSFSLVQNSTTIDYVWNYTQNKTLDVWGVWDTGYYLDIAANGYSSAISTRPETLNQANYAFFPLYPLFIRFVDVLTNDLVLSGFLISNISTFIASIFLYKLVSLEFNDDKMAKAAVTFMYFFPTAFVFTSLYTESLFLMLTIGAFYFLKKKNYPLAGILGFFSSLTRLTGILLVIPFLIDVFNSEQKFWDRVKNGIYAALIPLGTVVYSWYVGSLTGDVLAFLKIQQNWGRKIGNPLAYIIDGINSNLVQHHFTSWFTVLVLVLAVLSFFYLKEKYSVYTFYILLTPLLTGITSMPRYALSAFPLFIFLALVARKYPTLGTFITYGALLTQGIMLVFWVNGFDLLM